MGIKLSICEVKPQRRTLFPGSSHSYFTITISNSSVGFLCQFRKDQKTPTIESKLSLILPPDSVLICQIFKPSMIVFFGRIKPIYSN